MWAMESLDRSVELASRRRQPPRCFHGAGPQRGIGGFAQSDEEADVWDAEGCKLPVRLFIYTVRKERELLGRGVSEAGI